MAHLDATVGLDTSQALPVVRKIGIADLKDALVEGIDDFRAMPTHAIFLSIIYPVGAIIVAQLTLNDLFHLFFPLAAGFALIGPLAALGLYELSRQRELPGPLRCNLRRRASRLDSKFPASGLHHASGLDTDRRR
jgi:uncharacterized membrane protein